MPSGAALGIFALHVTEPRSALFFLGSALFFLSFLTAVDPRLIVPLHGTRAGDTSATTRTLCPAVMYVGATRSRTASLRAGEFVAHEAPVTSARAKSAAGRMPRVTS